MSSEAFAASVQLLVDELTGGAGEEWPNAEVAYKAGYAVGLLIRLNDGSHPSSRAELRVVVVALTEALAELRQSRKGKR